MRLHRNLVFTVIDSLMAIFNDGEYADKVVARALKKDKRWGSSDRKFVAETIYEVVRWKRLYTEIAEVKAPYDRDNVWRIFAVWAVLRGIKLPDWKYFESTPTRKIKGKFDEFSKTRALKEAIPDWMDELGVKELGEKVWTKELAAQNEQAKVVLRVNRLKTDPKKLKAELFDLDIETIQDQLLSVGLSAKIVGSISDNKEISVSNESENLFSESVITLEKYWREASHSIQAIRDNQLIADSELSLLDDEVYSGLFSKESFDESVLESFNIMNSKPRVAVLR